MGQKITMFCSEVCKVASGVPQGPVFGRLMITVCKRAPYLLRTTIFVCDKSLISGCNQEYCV